jgi:hypothetical protein
VRRLCLLLLGFALAALIGASAANALTATRSLVATHSFAGQGCGSAALATLTLPAGASNPRIIVPEVGQDLPSDTGDGSPVARITNTNLTRPDERWVATFTATGSDEVCARPANFPEGWATDDVDLVVQYTRRARVYVSGFTAGLAQRRPRRLIRSNRDLVRLRWSSWDGTVARGAGFLHIGSTFYPVAVSLSRPTLCGDRYRYLTLRYRYTGRVPRGRNRTNIASFDRFCP